MASREGREGFSPGESGRTTPPPPQGPVIGPRKPSTGGLETVRATVHEAVESVRDTVQDVGHSVASRAEAAWESTERGATQLARTAASGAEGALESATALVRRHPIPSLLIAFGAGFLLAQVLGRR